MDGETQKRNDLSALRVLAGGADGHPVLGVLRAFEGQVARVDFHRPLDPALPVGKDLFLGLAAGTSRQTFRTRASVLMRHDEADSVSYSFRLLRQNDEEGGEVLKALLGRSYQDRRAARVRPHPSRPVEVRLRQGEAGGVRRGLLQDISAVGLGVCVVRGEETAFTGEEPLRAVLRLDPADRSLVLECLVRRRHLQAGGILLGLEIDASSTTQLQRQKQRIERFVLLRQQEILRSARI